MSEKLILSYSTYEIEMNKLTQNILKHQNSKRTQYTHIYGFPRGGLPIAIHVSHHISKPIIYDINKFIKFINHEYNTYDTRILICDDLIDSGNTIENLIYKFDKYNSKIDITIATIFTKPRSNKTIENLKHKGITFISNKEVSNDKWVVFPWEHPDGVVDKTYMY